MATQKKVMKYSTLPELATLRLEDLPDELIVKVFSFLETRDLICLGQLSIRIRAISHDEQFWQKINLSYIDMKILNRDAKIPARFLNIAIKNGCKYLSLYPNQVDGNLGLDQASTLIYLKLQKNPLIYGQIPKKDYFTQCSVSEEMLSSCHSLQKLSMNSVTLTFDKITTICNQNGKTLQILDLNGCKIAGSFELWLEPVQVIVRNCTNLKEVNLDNTNMSGKAIQYLVENITPSIQVLSLNYCEFVKDEHIKILVNRCHELKTLNLAHTSVTSESLTALIETLKHSLKQLDITGSFGIQPGNFLELRAMPKLQTLIGSFLLHFREQLQNDLPNLVINNFGSNVDHQQFLNNFTSAENLSNKEGIWEIKAKPLKLFSSS